MRTRLGQKFRAVGQSQTVANASGINVDRTRVIAIMISTVLAGWKSPNPGRSARSWAGIWNSWIGRPWRGTPGKPWTTWA